jgi:hypothetical protein
LAAQIYRLKYCLTADSDVNILVTMATEHILSLLIAERDKLSKAIEALGGAPTKAVTSPKPVVAATPAAAVPAKKRKRTPLTAAQKKAHSERMKAFWAARRKKQAKG